MMQIQCSRCGKIKSFRYTVLNTMKLIDEGWGSYGRVLYCPECTKTWNERNDKPMAGAMNTAHNIDELYKRKKEEE